VLGDVLRHFRQRRSDRRQVVVIDDFRLDYDRRWTQRGRRRNVLLLHGPALLLGLLLHLLGSPLGGAAEEFGDFVGQGTRSANVQMTNEE
jgi:hypothetical protein